MKKFFSVSLLAVFDLSLMLTASAMDFTFEAEDGSSNIEILVFDLDYTEDDIDNLVVYLTDELDEGIDFTFTQIESEVWRPLSDIPSDIGIFTFELKLTSYGQDIKIPYGVIGSQTGNVIQQNHEMGFYWTSTGFENFGTPVGTMESTADNQGGLYTLPEGKTEVFRFSVMVAPNKTGVYAVIPSAIGYFDEHGDYKVTNFPTGYRSDYLLLQGVPEPSSALLLALGAMTIIARRPRKI